MRVDLRIPPCQPVPAVVRFCQLAEEAGFAGLGFLDTQLYLRDVYVTMSQVIEHTFRIRVHPAATCPGPRHTSVIAGAARTLHELAPDRFELWVGRGGSATTSAGLPRLRLGEMRQALTEIKYLLRGQATESDAAGRSETDLPVRTPGAATYSSGLPHGPRVAFGGGGPIPLLMVAGGPRACRLAAEQCDGVVFRAAPNAAAINEVRGWIRDGAWRGDRDPGEVEEWYQLRCVVRDDREEAVRTWSPMLLAVLAGDHAEQWLMDNGIRYQLRASTHERFRNAYASLRALYPDSLHPMDWRAAIQIAEVIPYELQERMGDRMAFLGTPADFAKQLQELDDLGIDNVYLFPCTTFELPEPELKAFQATRRTTS